MITLSKEALQRIRALALADERALSPTRERPLTLLTARPTLCRWTGILPPTRLTRASARGAGGRTEGGRDVVGQDQRHQEALQLQPSGAHGAPAVAAPPLPQNAAATLASLSPPTAAARLPLKGTARLLHRDATEFGNIVPRPPGLLPRERTATGLPAAVAAKTDAPGSLVLL